MAKSNGMDFVTVTDHNSIEGALELKALSPHDTFISAELTAYFPETGCKVHILVYDISEEQFSELNDRRRDIYKLREYIRREDIAYSVAHATYDINGKLNSGIVEKLILLFDVFEGRNGVRNKDHNDDLKEILQKLTPQAIARLRKKHRIEPFGTRSWKKGFTGGSDDHAALFIGKTYTTAACATKKQFIEQIKRKRSDSAGRSSDYKSVTFAIYKIAYEFSQRKTQKSTNFTRNLIDGVLFENRRGGFKNWLFLQKLKRSRKRKDRLFADSIEGFMDDFSASGGLNIDDKINLFYRHIAHFCDNFLAIIIDSVKKNIRKQAFGSMVKNATAILPVLFLCAPFFTTMKKLHANRELLDDLWLNIFNRKRSSPRRILWFTDTISDLNGVSVTLRQIANTSAEHDLPVRIVASSLNPDDAGVEAGRLLNLPPVYSYTPSFYRYYTMRFPSMLKSIEAITEYNPTEIIISTPGPVGILGLAAAKLLGARCSGVYHTDFIKQFEKMLGDSMLFDALETYIKKFYAAMDEILVPTAQYRDILKERGYESPKMRIFKRGVDTDMVTEAEALKIYANTKYDMPAGFNLLYAGRVSKDKNLEFLMRVYEELCAEYDDINLIVAGDGPFFSRMKEHMKSNPRVIFTGRIERRELFSLYCYADLFVFPSTTDTYGMVVLEAQACGLPALVSNIGGPQELIEDAKTGSVLPVRDTGAWVEEISRMRALFKQSLPKYLAVRERARKRVEKYYSWHEAVRDILKIRKPQTLPGKKKSPLCMR